MRTSKVVALALLAVMVAGFVLSPGDRRAPYELETTLSAHVPLGLNDQPLITNIGSPTAIYANGAITICVNGKKPHIRAMALIGRLRESRDSDRINTTVDPRTTNPVALEQPHSCFTYTAPEFAGIDVITFWRTGSLIWEDGIVLMQMLRVTEDSFPM